MGLRRKKGKRAVVVEEVEAQGRKGKDFGALGCCVVVTVRE